jgi:hypothetical protein
MELHDSKEDITAVNKNMKTYGGVEIQLHAFLTLALYGGKWSASRPGRFTPGERVPGTHWIGGGVGPRAGLDAVARRKLPATARIRTPVAQLVPYSPY